MITTKLWLGHITHDMCPTCPPIVLPRLKSVITIKNKESVQEWNMNGMDKMIKGAN